jgi:hypothetical protein
MDTTFRSQIDSANSILILLPQKPYFDQVAAGLALFLALRDTKKVEISCPNEMLVEFSRLIAVDKVTNELGSKNLVIKFPEYRAENIERVSYDIEEGEFKLTVIPKQEATPPSKDQVIITYSGISSDLVILIGGASESHFPAINLKDLAGVKKLHVGIRELATASDSGILSFARPASSTSELVGTLIKESGWEVDTDIATNLLLGIEVGTNHFSAEATTADTFQMVADLMKLGGRRTEKAPKPQSFPLGSIPGELAAKPEAVEEEKAPQDWLGPKIYKGTSIK